MDLDVPSDQILENLDWSSRLKVKIEKKLIGPDFN